MQEPQPQAGWMSFPAGLFQDQVAVITGGGTGLGLAMARGLCALGAQVTIASRKAEHHQPLLDEARANGWRAQAAVLDVREPNAVRDFAAQVRQRWGAVDILVNNAAGNFVCPTERLSTNAWRAVLSIVLDGSFYCSKEFGRGMIAEKRGSILNIVATYAWTGMPGVAHSASAKAGVLALTKTLAAEWAKHGIRVNAIAPGPFHSEGARENLWPDAQAERELCAKVPLGRFATSAEIAQHALWLLSPSSSWVTGECLVVDGGLSLPAQRMWGEGERLAKPRSGAPDA